MQGFVQVWQNIAVIHIAPCFEDGCRQIYVGGYSNSKEDIALFL